MNPAMNLPTYIERLDMGRGTVRYAVRPPWSSWTMEPQTADDTSADTKGRAARMYDMSTLDTSESLKNPGNAAESAT